MSQKQVASTSLETFHQIYCVDLAPDVKRGTHWTCAILVSHGPLASALCTSSFNIHISQGWVLVNVNITCFIFLRVYMSYSFLAFLKQHNVIMEAAASTT